MPVELQSFCTELRQLCEKYKVNISGTATGAAIVDLSNGIVYERVYISPDLVSVPSHDPRALPLVMIPRPEPVQPQKGAKNERR